MGTETLAPADRNKLVKLLGMLGSDHDGEVINAGRAASRLVRKLGLTMDEIVAPDLALPPPPPPPPPTDWRELVFELLERPHALSSWEESFLRSLLKFRQLSSKQMRVLADIDLKMHRPW
jgi:hypothetical protein